MSVKRGVRRSASDEVVLEIAVFKEELWFDRCKILELDRNGTDEVAVNV